MIFMLKSGVLWYLLDDKEVTDVSKVHALTKGSYFSRLYWLDNWTGSAECHVPSNELKMRKRWDLDDGFLFRAKFFDEVLVDNYLLIKISTPAPP